ncbi:trypsin-7-like isoform X2 [Maniola jurtina]|uniref:trypsin-7-like isoform X2 n=1 Tax=Maniola jurtina TaxID=191418 RepID=UPI001E6873ED|nr:trypsin-7-like isoform X2 [Maniola jurtina]
MTSLISSNVIALRASTILVMIRTIFIYFLIYRIAPVHLKKYDLIVIPIHNVPHSHKDPKIQVWPSLKKFRSNNDLLRLDIGHYDEATEMIDIDNFDYINDRDSEERQALSVDEHLARYGQNRIVGGVEVDNFNLYPYHAAYGTNCGGTIFDKKWVITAGHCGKKAYVRVGSKYLNQGKRVPVKKSFIHPLWAARDKAHPFDYDFQLLELGEDLKFDDNIQPMKLARIEDMVIGKVITVTGWGNTRENGPYSRVLRAVRVPIVSKESCQQVPFPYFRGALTPRMFCAGFSEGMKDACQGDSGGPAVAYDRLLGMVSFGYGCATPGSYGVYSKVAKVRPWIEKVTGLTLD